MKGVLAAIIIFLVSSGLPAKGSSEIPIERKILVDKSIKIEPGKPVLVAKVIDGDTVVLENGEELRYIGIDTPEIFPNQCFADLDTQRNRKLVEGRNIIFDIEKSTYDRYGRRLGYVYLDTGFFLNLQLVNEGFAFAYPYPPDTSKAELFSSAQKSAQDKNLGIWGFCNRSSLPNGRNQTNIVN